MKKFPKPKQIPSLKNKQAIRNKYGKPVYQFNLSGTFIKEYPSLGEAGQQTGISPSNIRRCILGKTKTAGNFV